MGTIKKTRKKEAKACIEEQRGNPCVNPFIIADLNNVFINEYAICRDNGLGRVDFAVLVMLVNSWEGFGFGMNCYQMCLEYVYKGNNVTAMHERMIRFLSLGYVVVVGTGVGHSKLYGPTDKAIGLVYEFISNLSKGR